MAPGVPSPFASPLKPAARPAEPPQPATAADGAPVKEEEEEAVGEGLSVRAAFKDATVFITG